MHHVQTARKYAIKNQLFHSNCDNKLFLSFCRISIHYLVLLLLQSMYALCLSENLFDNFRDLILYTSQQKKRQSLPGIRYAKSCKENRTTVRPASNVTMKLNMQTKALQWVSLQGMICIWSQPMVEGKSSILSLGMFRSFRSISLLYVWCVRKKIDVRLLNFCCVGNLGVHMISKASFCLHQRRLMGSLDLAAQR